MTEPREEVGVDATAVMSPRLFAFSEDPLHHTFELVWELETPLIRWNTGRTAALPHREHAESFSYPGWT
jgi:hypothetical protein